MINVLSPVAGRWFALTPLFYAFLACLVGTPPRIAVVLAAICAFSIAKIADLLDRGLWIPRDWAASLVIWSIILALLPVSSLASWATLGLFSAFLRCSFIAFKRRNDAL